MLTVCQINAQKIEMLRVVDILEVVCSCLLQCRTIYDPSFTTNGGLPSRVLGNALLV